MTLSHVLLGLLSEPRSGYDLKKHLDRVAAHYWAATQTQIYVTAHRLEEAGEVVAEEAPSDKGPARRVYRRTPVGERRLVAWIEAGPAFVQPRSAELAQVHQLHVVGGESAGGAGAGAFIRSLRSDRSPRLARVRADIANLGPPRSLDPVTRSDYLMLTMVERRLAADLVWCDEAVDVM